MASQIGSGLTFSPWNLHYLSLYGTARAAGGYRNIHLPDELEPRDEFVSGGDFAGRELVGLPCNGV